ncbi:MAG: hypothetical protein KDA84_10740, partial [Planctomycetaceae bacterium]|nr:hypothetical protein [Planctomycetaceae bacterium]
MKLKRETAAMTVAAVSFTFLARSGETTMVPEMIRTLIVNVDYDRWYSPAKFGKDCGLSNEDVKAFSNACLQEAGEAVRWNVDGIQIQGCDLYSATLRL